MARFLYFVRGLGGSSIDVLPADHHVRKMMAGTQADIRDCSAGPDGEPGAVIMAAEGGNEERATAHGFYPHRQTWMEHQGFWLGWETENPPGPEDLKRERGVGGDEVRLGDGRDWQVPLLGPAWKDLPGYVQATPSGGCEVVLREEYRAICEESEYWFDVLSNNQPNTLERLFGFAADTLGCNYRMGKPELGALKLIGTDPKDNGVFVAAATGMQRAVDELKKKREAGGLAAPAGN